MGITIAKLESELYNEIIDAYRLKLSYNAPANIDLFVYGEIIKLMEILKNYYYDDTLLVKKIVANCLFLLINLFLNDDNDNPDNQNAAQSAYLRGIFFHTLDAAN